MFNNIFHKARLRRVRLGYGRAKEERIMNAESLKFLTDLLETPSPSGFEKAAAEIWKKEAVKITRYVKGDIHGNSIAANGSAHLVGKIDKSLIKKPLIMLAGHIDEIGLQVNYIDPDGFVYFQPIGGWDAQILPGQRVKIHGKDGRFLTKGVIGRAAAHLLGKDKEAVKIGDLWIDTGLGKETGKIISVGDYAVVDYGPELLGDNLASRGLDDKIGAYIVLEALKLVKEKNLDTPDVVAVATVQEEVGLRGAKTSAYGLNPDIGIAIDVTHETGYPGADKKKNGDIKFGAGPVIAVGPNITMKIYDLLVETAKRHKIPYQIEAAPDGTGTDANAIQLTRSGVATGLVSIPCRYMHSPCEMVNMNDVENAVKLLAHFCVACREEK